MLRLFKLMCLILLVVGISQSAFSVSVEAIRNGNFSDSYRGWAVNHQYGTRKPNIQINTNETGPDDPYLDLSSCYGQVLGAALFQSLNVTNCAGKTFTFSMDLVNYSYGSPNIQMTLDYVDTKNSIRTLEIMQVGWDYEVVEHWKTYSTQFTMPSDARKIIKISMIRSVNEYSMDFSLDNISLAAVGIVAGPVPVVTSIDKKKAAYGTDIVISGSGFGPRGEVTSWPQYGPAKIKSWSDNTIIATVDDPFRTGWIKVSSDFVDAVEENYFYVTSPYYTTQVTSPFDAIVKGQSAEFELHTFAINGFRSEQGAMVSVIDAPTGTATVAPANVKIPGSTLIKINTSSLSLGKHTFHLKISAPGCADVVKPISLNVVTAAELVIKDSDTGEPLTSLNSNYQGSFEIRLCGTDSNGQSISGNDIKLVSSDPSVVVALDPEPWQRVSDERTIWYLKTGTATITATTPDGCTRSLPVRVNLTGVATVNNFAITPNTLTNKGGQIFTAKASAPFKLDMAFPDSSLADCSFTTTLSQTGSTYSCEARSTVGNRAEPGTYWIRAYCSDTSNLPPLAPVPSAIARLTVVNDPLLGEITGSILGTSGLDYLLVMVQVCNAKGEVLYQKSSYIGRRYPNSYRISGIKPGTYYVRFGTCYNQPPGEGEMTLDGRYQQWYYGGTDIANATPVTVTAGQTKSNVNFFFPLETPRLYHKAPFNDEEWVSPDANVECYYQDQSIDPRTLVVGFDRLEDEDHNIVEGTVNVDDSGWVRFHPANPLALGRKYTAFINSAAMTLYGIQATEGYSWSFTTLSNKLGDLRKVSNQQHVTLPGMILHYVNGNTGYIEEPDRASGILITCYDQLDTWITAGCKMDVVGQFYPSTEFPEGTAEPHIYVYRSLCKNLGPASVKPFCMTNTDAKLPMAGGLRTTVWGRVIPGSIDLAKHSYRITDGSDANGIKIIDQFAVPTVTDNEFVIVTGACGTMYCEQVIYKF